MILLVEAAGQFCCWGGDQTSRQLCWLRQTWFPHYYCGAGGQSEGRAASQLPGASARQP